MNILTVTTLYPNAAAPAHGIFVESRLAAYRDLTGDDIRVIAPVPWFPSTSSLFGRYARYAAAPAQEVRKGIPISHPRFLLAPRWGMTIAPATLSRSIVRAAQRLINEGWDFDLIDAHYLYPDGVAAARVAKLLRKPFVLTARGSDVSLLPNYSRPRMMILDAIRRANAVITVAADLKKRLIEIGAPAEKITVLRNGVDLELFNPVNRETVRREMNLDGPVAASVGHLIPRKGHDIAIRAAALYPNLTLLIVGDGTERLRLAGLASRLGIARRVRFLGARPQTDLRNVYGAADALLLCSEREGWANVLLEAMACGTPAVASNAGGNAEVVSTREAGSIAADRTPEAFAEALRETIDRADRTAVRRHAERHSWRETAEGMRAIFNRAGRCGASRRSAGFALIAPRILRPPTLIVTVDVEEQFDWGEPGGAYAACDPADMDRFQQLAESFGAHPIYFLTHHLLVDPRSAAHFRKLKEQGLATLGVHPHTWNTPPTIGFDSVYYSWQCNLPVQIQKQKLAAIAEAFKAAFGEAPVAHRAGRYGISAEAIAALAATGLRYDFSPSPGFDFSAEGGPNFSGMANDPFAVECDNATVFVTPVSGARAVRGGRRFLSQPSASPGFTGAPRRMPHCFSAPQRLTCEGAGFEDLAALTRRLVADGASILTFSLHSTSMTEGANPYAQGAGSVERSLAVAGRYFAWFTSTFGGSFIGFAELAAAYESAR